MSAARYWDASPTGGGPWRGVYGHTRPARRSYGAIRLSCCCHLVSRQFGKEFREALGCAPCGRRTLARGLRGYSSSQEVLRGYPAFLLLPIGKMGFWE